MREIKFRAWDKEANIMVYSDDRTRKLYDVYYGFEMNSKGELECNWEGEFSESHVLDGGTLDNIMQYTGLKDQHGEEIYEGDIVSFEDSDGGYEYQDLVTNTGTVEYGELRFYFTNRVAAEMDDFYIKDGRCDDVEVIGNIYENPELLEVPHA